MSRLRVQFDLILIDGPPLLKVAYATSLLRLVDSVIAVIPRGSDVRDASDLRKRCDLLNTRISGILFTHDTMDAKSSRPAGSARGVFEEAGEGPATVSRLSH
jgi:Mrp family chromosome partitioning ATPase